jgi:hypothetical protein
VLSSWKTVHYWISKILQAGINSPSDMFRNFVDVHVLFLFLFLIFSLSLSKNCMFTLYVDEKVISNLQHCGMFFYC